MALPVTAAYYVALRNPARLPEILRFAHAQGLPICVLGGGSNVIFRGDYPGLVIHLLNQGITLQTTQDDMVRVHVAAGEQWDDFLQVCLRRHWFGLENLAMIPGTVGAAPVQNIGAYGQEVAECIEAVHCVNRHTLTEHQFQARDCQFAYRDSLFKSQAADTFIITAVDFQLHTTPNLNLTYQPLAALFPDQSPTPMQLRQAVMNIRASKLPDPKQLANSGSFFKNPVVSAQTYQQLKAQYPAIPGYPTQGAVKLAAGWLIQHCGWKGKNIGPVGMYEKQALVLVNYGGGTFSAVQVLLERVQQDVFDRFGVQLEQEPVMIY